MLMEITDVLHEDFQQLAAGIIAHSNAMISDAIHSASDVFSACAVGEAVSGSFPEAFLKQFRHISVYSGIA